MRQFCAVLVAITIGILPGWTLAEAQQVLQVPPGSRVTASLEGNTAVITVIGAQPGESPAQSPVDVSDLAAPPGAEDILGVSTDPETGITTIVRRNPDGTTTASAAQRVLLPDGSELLMEIGENGEIRETRIAPNGEFSTTITKGKDQTTAAVTDSESIHVLESDRDGSTHTRRDADGTIVHEQRNAAGELQETVTERADGWVEEQEPNGNVRTTYTNPTDGTTTVIEVDEDGNTRTTVTDRAGKVVRNDVQQVTEPEPGRRYFEEVLNGTDWDDLPKSLKNRYADSEHDIRQRETARAQEEAEAAKKRLEDEQQAAESRTVTEEMEKSFAALRTEEEEAAQRSAERRAEDERRQKIAESREKTRELREQHAAALARGDQREATRLSHLMDEHHEASMELLQATESEEREMNRLAEIRQRLASQVFNRASAAAEQQIGIDQADQDAKDAITSKTKWVSIGSQMQQETSATTRMADRERAYAEAKQAEIDRMLNHDKLTSAERKILSEMRELGVVQEEGAERLLSDNANITAAGYVLDGVLTVTGGKLIEGGRRLAVGAANRALSREVAKKVISVTAERGVIDVAGAGITRAATATTERLVSEKAAATVGRVLGTDVSTPAAQFAERAARRVLGDRAVEAVASGATRVAEVATTDVVELVRGRTGSEATATTAAREAAAAREATATTPRQPAPRQPAPRETPPPARESSVAKKPSDMNAAERQAYNDAKADEAVRRALDERPAANTADDLAGHEVTAKTERVKRPSEMTPAERQAYNDRMANRAIRERRGSSPDLDDELLPGPVETPSNRPFTREEVEALHDPARRLTQEELKRKAELYRTREQARAAQYRAANERRPVGEVQEHARRFEKIDNLIKEGHPTHLDRAARPTRMPASSEPRPTTARPGTETAVLDNVPSRPATTPRPAPRPHETQVLTPEEIAGTQYGNATMPAESLRDFARNPRVRTAVDPERTSRFSRMTKFDEPAEMVKARSRWLQVPEARKVGIDAELRRAIDEAAAVGDKWARRAQQDLNAGKFNFSYEPGITKYDGLALSSDHVVINPFDGTRIRSGDELASILIHEYIHAYKGGTKFASNLPGFTGSPTRGRYNEGRAYLGEAIFNRNLGRARQLTGAPLDPTAANLVNKYMNTGNLASQTPGYARGSRAFENLREYITDHIYGGKYAGNPALAAERLAAFRGGGMEHIQKYIRDQLQKRPGDADEVMAALLKEIEREGGRFLPRP